jgi:hypothetical protein
MDPTFLNSIIPHIHIERMDRADDVVIISYRLNDIISHIRWKRIQQQVNFHVVKKLGDVKTQFILLDRPITTFQR